MLGFWPEMSHRFGIPPACRRRTSLAACEQAAHLGGWLPMRLYLNGFARYEIARHLQKLGVRPLRHDPVPNTGANRVTCSVSTLRTTPRVAIVPMRFATTKSAANILANASMTSSRSKTRPRIAARRTAGRTGYSASALRIRSQSRAPAPRRGSAGSRRRNTRGGRPRTACRGEFARAHHAAVQLGRGHFVVRLLVERSVAAFSSTHRSRYIFHLFAGRRQACCSATTTLSV